MPPVTNATAPADLLPHEIAGPVWYLPFPLPYMIAGGVVLLVFLAAAVWGFVAWRRYRNRRPLTAREKALAALVKARAQAPTATPYRFSIEVCDVLRTFLAAEHRLPATTQTSYEFLQTARGSGMFDAERLSHLTRFLDKADMIKFARAEATGADNAELTELAEDLVKGGTADAVAA